MVFTRLHRRWTAWFAICAILLGALAPTVSHGVRAWSQAPIAWVEVCSSTGNKLVAVAMDHGFPEAKVSSSAQQADAGHGLPSGEHAGEHCPFCLVHAHDVALPASPPPIPRSMSGAEALPDLFLHAPRTLFAWAPPQARAPPASV